MRIRILFLFTIFSVLSFAQEKVQDSITRKKITAVKLEKAPKIDGNLDDDAWKNIPIAKDFIEFRPNNGKAEDADFKSEVKIAYDDTGIYVSAMLYDKEPSKISKELTERDNIGNDDFFVLFLNGYNDKQQSLELFVTAAGVQADSKITNENGEDFSWNGIWYSAAKIVENGWTVEMKIPFSELRFPKSEVQNWGLNFFRQINRTKTAYTWNYINNQKGGFLLYDGVLENIKNIDPPIRLSFMPYFSTYVNNYDGQTTTNFNGGMDVKYGINDAFTFDMTLIPDFGQANFDNSVLNLTPFEQQFTEQRSFFNEGTELFEKGNMFYSRRVGGYPSKSANVSADETLVEEPSKVKLFNAFKISGRTNKGLGIGFFNGITEKAEAIIKNNITGETRKEILEPWANYNVLVLDQRFNENSSITFVNTNTMRSGSFRDANSTGLLWNIRNKKNTYQYYGNVKGSWVMDDWTKFGNKSQFGFGKVSGKHRFDVNANFTTKNWDINDLGFSTTTNIANYNAWYGYRILQPIKRFNNIYLNNSITYSHRLDPFLFSTFRFNHNNQFTDKNFRSFGGGVEFTPFGEKDIFEPREFGRHLNVPGYFDSWIWYESDSRKKLQFNVNIDYYAYNEKGRNKVIPSVFLRYRFNDKFNVIWQFNPVFSNNEVGFAGNDGTNIFMGRRQRNTYENSLTSQFSFNDKMTLSLAFRHYFSDVTYHQFYTLNQDGSLANTNNFSNNLNGTYNSWNVDLRYTWWFAPGSQLTLLYRNAVSNYQDVSRLTFGKNFDTLFNEPMTNNISLRLTYFLDYNRAKNWFKKS